MDGRALDLAPVGRITAAALGVILAVDLRHTAVGVLLAAGAGDQIRALEANLEAGVHTLVFRRGNLHEVVRFDPQLAGEADLARAVFRTQGIILDRQKLGFALRIVRDDELHRMQHGHDALCVLVQIVAQAAFKQRPVDRGVDFRHADALAEIADGLRGVAAAAQTAERRHTRIIPAGDAVLLDQLTQLALGHDGVVDAETRELYLTRLDAGDGHVRHDPVVQRAVRLVLKRAEGVRDALQRVLYRVGEVVHREDTPLCALTVMLDISDAVQHRIAHVEVAACEVDLGAQGVAAFLKFAVLHPLKEVEVLLDRPVAPGADGGVRGVAPVFAELLGGKLADVGKPFLYKLDGVFIGLFKVIGAIVKPVAPVKAEPVDVFFDGVDVLGVLLGGVGVVHAQIAETAELLRRAEVDAQRLAVADVQIAVRLGRETGVHRFSGKPSAGGNVLSDKIMNKIAGFSDLFHIDSLHFIS